MAVALKYFGVAAIFKSKYLRNTLFYCIMYIFARIARGEAEAILYHWVSNTFDTHIMYINNLCVDNLFYWRKIWEMKRLKAGYIL